MRPDSHKKFPTGPLAAGGITVSRPKKHYDETRAAARRKQVLDAAGTCFLRHGFHGASMAAISRAAGMSVGHIYNYFTSKEDIIAAMCESEMARLLARFQAMAASRERFVGELKHILRERIAEETDSGHGALLRDLSAEMGRNETITRAIQDFDRRMRQELTGLCRLHAPEMPERVIAARIEILLLLFDGYVMRGIANPAIDTAAYTEEIESLIETLFPS